MVRIRRADEHRLRLIVLQTPDAVRGPLAKVKNGDRIRLSVKERRLDLLVAPEELARRKTAPAAIPERGYARLYRREILQADRGCDFDFLRKHPIGDGRA
jgi:dihydroxy-acid dehydratase